MARLAPSSRSRAADAPRERGRGRATSGVPEALRALGIRPSRRLGQSFLIDPRVAERIASLVDDPLEPVLEIGPGLGALTTLLARTGRPLVAVEMDRRLAEAAERALAPHPASRVARGDILEQRIDALFPVAGGDAADGGKVTVVGNLPYSITTPALEWILSQAGSVRRALLMVQREYAQRLAADPGTKSFGSISVFVRLHAEIHSLFRVSPGAFYPRPDVESLVLELLPRPFPGTTAAVRSDAERLARAGMGTRRKTLANALARGLGLEVLAVRRLLGEAGIAPERRGETLGVDAWVGLARVWAARAEGES